MNVERMRKLAVIIEKSPAAHFDMSEYENEPECGSARCIAGFAVHQWGDIEAARGPGNYYDGWFEQAAKILRLSDSEAMSLFMGNFSERAMSRITRAEAAAELRRLANEAEAAA